MVDRQWEAVSPEQREQYIRHANYLIEHNYVDITKYVDIVELAKEIFEKEVKTLNEAN